MEIMALDQYKSLDENDNLTKIRQFDRNSNLNALILGKLLADNIEFQYWKKLGYESFKAFVGEEGFSFTQRSAYNYVDLWKMFCRFAIEMEEFTSIPYSKLLKIKDVVDEKNLEEWLGKVKTLSRTDLELELKESKANKEGKPYVPMPKMYLCPDCNKWVIDVMPSELCECGKGLKGEELAGSGMAVKLEHDKWSNK